MNRLARAGPSMLWGSIALCGAGACLPLAVGVSPANLLCWVYVAGGMAGLCGAVRLLLGKPPRRGAPGYEFDFSDEKSASRNAELRAGLLRR